jgi:hypothetical protein
MISNAFRPLNGADIIHVISGTFDPLHAGHRAIYNRMSNQIATFEISLVNKDKEISEKQLDQIIYQFFENDLPLIITRCATYQEKIELFQSIGLCPTFHMGVDTAMRLLMDEGKKGVEQMPADFIVYDRETLSLNDPLFRSRIPSNMARGLSLPEEVRFTSSTKLRTKND